MSVIPFTTQIGQSQSQTFLKVVLVYTDKMTERQSALMKDCQNRLSQNIEILIQKANELDTLSRKMKVFVVPSLRDDIVRRLNNRFERPAIYLPRAVIEARGWFQISLPMKKLAVSLTMYSCRIFLVKNCDLHCIRVKINEMCGHFASDFKDSDLNVVITDRADNKYCARATKRNIPVVSKKWVDDNYIVAMEEESDFFYKDAKSTLEEHQIKPFHGLHFKIMSGTSGAHLKKLITDNQGHIIYGNENCLTHIVVPPNHDMPDVHDQSDSSDKSSQKPKLVDEEFLRACVDSGYYMTKKEYRESRMSSDRVVVKQEYRSQEDTPMEEENYAPHTPPINNEYSIDASENQAMLPPSHLARPPRQQPDNMNDIILKALSSMEPAQTQPASTQMRRVPDPELRIEQTLEPSQQLYWNDSASRRN